MKKLLFILIALNPLINTLIAEEFIEIKPKNIYSYKKSSLVKWENDSKRYIDIINNQFKTQYNGDIKKFENILPKNIFKNLNLIAFEGNIVINNKYFAKRLAEYVDARNNGTELQDVPLIEFHYITHHNKRKYTISIIRYGYNSYSDMVGLASTIGGSVKFR